MKPFWKKVNRGLLLGAVLLVVLIVVAVVQTVSFRRQKPAIRQEVKSYVNDLLSVTYVVGEEITPGTELTDAQKQARREKFEAFAEKHWQEVSEKEISSGSILTGTLSGLDSTRAWFDNTLLGKQYPIKQLNLPILQDSDISVSAGGPNYAQVSVWFSFSTATEDSEAGKEGILQLELKRVKGSWKVIASNISIVDTWNNQEEMMGGKA